VGWVGGTMKAEIATAVDFLVSKLMAQVNEMRIHTRLHVACAGHVSPTLSPLLLCHRRTGCLPTPECDTFSSVTHSVCHRPGDALCAAPLIVGVLHSFPMQLTVCRQCWSSI
jgi:hypothetical protein